MLFGVTPLLKDSHYKVDRLGFPDERMYVILFHSLNIQFTHSRPQFQFKMKLLTHNAATAAVLSTAIGPCIAANGTEASAESCVRHAFISTRYTVVRSDAENS